MAAFLVAYFSYRELMNVAKPKPQNDVIDGTEPKNELPIGEVSNGDQPLSDTASTQTPDSTPTTEAIKTTAEKSDIDALQSEPEVVTLKGWEDGREGNHSIHTKKGVYNFVNGRASYSSVIAIELREAGYVE